jgi:myo-inositol 2-dehydrogenase / D-chiro-inositol 1-dehydrogenase
MHSETKTPDSSRRQFLKASLVAGFPTIVPATVFGQTAPSNLIQVAQIGCGRQARDSEIAGVLRHSDLARFVAICELDTVRMADAKTLIEGTYDRKLGGKHIDLKTYGNYREMLEDKSIDAVCISTPDHWHALPTIEAALAGKDIYLQKPASLTIKEGRQMADAVKKTNRIFQQGSQQRSAANFRLACELVRNGRIGRVREVYIGLPTDPAGGDKKEMPVPANLNYDMWLGSTPMVYYTEDRVHPQTANARQRYGRPGWLRCEQFGAGMITGWGAHHVDTAHWGMGTELTGPVELEAMALFPKQGLWDVHGPYHIRCRYADGTAMYISDKYPNGIKFVGEKGWIWVTRGSYSAVDMQAVGAARPDRSPWSAAIDASDRRWLTEGIKDNEIRLHASPRNDHHLDWLTSIKTRQETVAPAEVGHRANSVCLLAQMAMHTDRTLTWDPAKERFTGKGADEANTWLARKQRAAYSTDAVMAKAGLA